LVRTLIVDDHGVLRAALRALLQSHAGLEVVGEASDGQETLRLVDELQPDLVLMDISMPQLNGIAATQEVKKRLPNTHVLILTVHEDEELVREAMRAGASGYVVKRALESELLDAIAAVLRGELYVHPAMMRSLVGDLAPRTSPGKNAAAEQNGDDELTVREVQVLTMIAKGHTNLQIASTLALSVRTVESHRANIMEKLNLRSRADLVRYALAHKLVKER
jgi:two-component system, NarL family, response regulator NreC